LRVKFTRLFIAFRDFQFFNRFFGFALCKRIAARIIGSQSWFSKVSFGSLGVEFIRE
jgi:hypothetical protein